jgi:hypothetical protein
MSAQNSDKISAALERRLGDSLQFEKPVKRPVKTPVIKDFGFYAGDWRVDKHPRMLADLTGNGIPDIIGFGNAGVYVALNRNGSFTATKKVVNDLGVNQGWRVDKHPRMLADLTGGGRADIIGFGNSGVFVALNKGRGTFEPAKKVLNEFGLDKWSPTDHLRLVGDLTGNGCADIVGFGETGVYAAFNRGDGTFEPIHKIENLDDFGHAYPGSGGWETQKHPRFLVDLRKKGYLDMLGFGEVGVYVARNNGDGTFQPMELVLENHFDYYPGGWHVEKHPRMLADITGDGYPDIVGFYDNGVWIALNKRNGTFAQPKLALADFGYEAGDWRVDKHPRMLADVSGDGRADIVGFGDDGVYVARSKGRGAFHPAKLTVKDFGFVAGTWCVERHPRILADINGDGRADLVCFGHAGVYIHPAQ